MSHYPTEPKWAVNLAAVLYLIAALVPIWIFPAVIVLTYYTDGWFAIFMIIGFLVMILRPMWLAFREGLKWDNHE